MLLRSVIIDDEQGGIDALRQTIELYCPEVEVVATTIDSEKGPALLNRWAPDILFLDIQMPKLTGFQMLEQMGQVNFHVIFVTAFDIQAIRYSALDYLVKPVDGDELVAAIQRRSQIHGSLNYQFEMMMAQFRQPHPYQKLAIPTENEILLKEYKDIIYIEADGSYSVVHLVDAKKITVSKLLKDFENLLPSTEFCRIHHASLVNMAHVVRYIRGEGGWVELTGGLQRDVSRRKKEHFLQLLQKM